MATFLACLDLVSLPMKQVVLAKYLIPIARKLINFVARTCSISKFIINTEI